MLFALLFIIIISLFSSKSEAQFTADGETFDLQAGTFISYQWNQDIYPYNHPYNKHFIDLIKKSKKNIEQVLLARKYLWPILNAYRSSPYSKNSDITDQAMKIALKNYKSQYDSDLMKQQFLTDANLLFRWSPYDFKVEGTDAVRMAINTNSQIIFNLKLLSESKLNYTDAIQILLHEISHAIKDIPIETKDIWSTDVASWVNSKTKKIDLKNNISILIVDLPQKAQSTINQCQCSWAGNVMYNKNDNDVFINAYNCELENSFILIKETEQEVAFFMDLYLALPKLSQVTGQNQPMTTSNIPNNPLWARLSVTDLKKRGETNFSLKIKSKINRLVWDRYENTCYMYMPDAEESSFNNIFNLYNEFEVEYDIENKKSGIASVLSVDDYESDFKIKSVNKKSEKIELKIEVTGTNLIDARNLISSVLLIGQSASSRDELTFIPDAITQIEDQKYTLSFTLADESLNLTKLLIIMNNDHYKKSQIVIRPDSKQVLEGPAAKKYQKKHFNSFKISTIKEKKYLTFDLKTSNFVKPVGLRIGFTAYITVFDNTSGVSKRFDPSMYKFMQITNRLFSIPFQASKLYKISDNTKLAFEISQDPIDFKIAMSDPMSKSILYDKYVKNAGSKIKEDVDDSLNRLINQIEIIYDNGTVENVDLSVLNEDDLHYSINLPAEYSGGFYEEILDRLGN